jgi:acyl-coenzyme A synthetase/AMP-(fatty) acid ligase
VTTTPTFDYDRAVREFRAEPPSTFNFGRDVVDAHAAAADRLALLATNDAGAVARYAFSDVARRSAQYAHVLARAGLRAGDRVLVQLPRIADWHFAMTACTKLGAVPVPCIEMLTAKDVAYRIAHCDAGGVITTPANVAKYADCGTLRVRACIGAADGWIDLPAEGAREPGEFACADTGAQAPAILYYTSGSTGMPKGVTHAARALWAWKYSALTWQGVGPGDLLWCTADTGWSKSGTSSLFGPWGAGAAVMFHDGVFDARRRLQLLAEHPVDVFCAAATEFRQFVQLDLSGQRFARLRLCVSAGESVNPEVVTKWKRATGIELLDGYGQTETLMTILNYPGMPVKPGSMGRPIPGARFEVIDDHGAEQPAGTVGHVAMALPHPQFMLGYWNDPDKTRAQIVATPRGERWITGDTGWCDTDGYWFYAGRADDVIGSAGYRIGPMEVENALMEHPAVREVAVVGKPDAKRGEIVKAFVVLRDGVEGSDALAAELQEFVRTITAPYKYPREIEFRAELPKNAAGKLLRRVLRDAERERTASGGSPCGTDP